MGCLLHDIYRLYMPSTSGLLFPDSLHRAAEECFPTNSKARTLNQLAHRVPGPISPEVRRSCVSVIIAWIACLDILATYCVARPPLLVPYNLFLPKIVLMLCLILILLLEEVILVPNYI